MKNALLFLFCVVFTVSSAFAQDRINADDRRGRIANFDEEDLVWVAFDCNDEQMISNKMLLMK
jgi:hypothetical protein